MAARSQREMERQRGNVDQAKREEEVVVFDEWVRAGSRALASGNASVV